MPQYNASKPIGRAVLDGTAPEQGTHPVTANPDPKTIDYTRRGWGHDFQLDAHDGGQRLTGFIWSHRRPRVGDYLILPNKGETTRYRLTEAEWTVNVDDMYRVTLQFDPRTETEPAEPKP